MKLNNSQIDALCDKVEYLARKDVEAAKSKLISAYIPTQDYKDFEKALRDRNDACERLNNLGLTGFYDAFKVFEDKTINRMLKNFIEKEISSELPKYSFDQLRNDIILESLGSKNLDLLVEKLLNSCKECL